MMLGSNSSRNMCLAKVLEQVKAAALAELEDKITENVMGRVEKMLEEKIQNDKLPENED